MLFYSPIYLFIFLPIVLILYFNSNYIYKKKILILSSIFFYSYWNIYFLPIILFSVVFNYFLAEEILKIKDNKKKYLIFSIFINVLLLVIFKYLDFIIFNLNLFLNLSINYFNIPFPLAISFFTFQSIAFLINCYDKEISKINFEDFFLFMLFFPQLIAGPIVKFNKMVPQYNDVSKISFNVKNFNLGLFILVIGFIKKVYFADTLSLYVDSNYENISSLDFISAWILTLSFTFQLYFDFSGYIDMATGSALMLNISLPNNFDSPLKSSSIIDFWRRWHITLSHFLTNYLYTPWLKSLKEITFFKSMLLIFIVFVIAGLWHGPAWNFVFFGALHGMGLVFNHIYRKFVKLKINSFIYWFITFNFVNVSFVFFRSTKSSDTFFILKKMVNFKSIELNNFFISINNNLSFYSVLILSIIICLFFNNTNYLIKKNR